MEKIQESDYVSIAHECYIVNDVDFIPDIIDLYYSNSKMKGITFYKKIIDASLRNGLGQLQSSVYDKHKKTIKDHCDFKIKEIKSSKNETIRTLFWGAMISVGSASLSGLGVWALQKSNQEQHQELKLEFPKGYLICDTVSVKYFEKKK
ncbi:MAG TPA: hypothetical protein VN026_13140 [Bacteroidia bacterium]|jgi:hypothetical protein|nr:hypothetical protein [Bacteroidia bacterium]